MMIHSERPSSCGHFFLSPAERRLLLAALLVLVASTGGLALSFFSHTPDGQGCACVRCLLDTDPQEGGFLYNRFLLAVSLMWLSLLVVAGVLFRNFLKR